MAKTLNEIKLANFQSELMMAYGCNNESRIQFLKTNISEVQSDIGKQLKKDNKKWQPRKQR